MWRHATKVEEDAVLYCLVLSAHPLWMLPCATYEHKHVGQPVLCWHIGRCHLRLPERNLLSLQGCKSTDVKYPAQRGSPKVDVCVAVHRWYNNINSKLDATIIILRLNKTPTWCNKMQILLLPFVPNMAKWGSTCNHNYLYRWLPCQYFIFLMMGAWSPKHVEKVCGNKICILFHHVGVLFNLILWCTETLN